MKIAVNTRLLVSQKMDGIGRFTFETLAIITKKHPEHQFVYLFDRKVDDAFSFEKNVETVVLSPQARHPILWIIWFEFQLKRYLNKKKFDLYLSPEGWVPPNLNCKTLAVMHDLNFEHHPENIIYSHRKYLKHYFPKFAKRSDRIATVSEYSKKDISSCYNYPTNKIDVVYNGANSLFEPVDSSIKDSVKKSYTSGNEYFLFIGTLHPRKNLEHLFLGFDQFKKETNSEVKLLVAGNKKWWPKELESIFQGLQHKDDIIFMGRLSDKDLAEVLGSALALTYLPYFEGFGIPILEAFQAETAVITSNVTSMPEVAADAALLCNPRSKNEIARAMQQISSDSNLRKQLIEKGRHRALDFSWEKSADLLWNSIEKTLN